MMARSFHGYSSLTLLLIMLFCSFSYFHTSQVESPILMEKNIQKTNSNDVNFSAAGSEKISIIGQPIHLGDSVKASILIRLFPSKISRGMLDQENPKRPEPNGPKSSA